LIAWPRELTRVFLPILATSTTGTVEARIHSDAAGSPGALVSDYYVSETVTVVSSTSAYELQFVNANADLPLQPSTYYWIVLTSPVAMDALWVVTPSTQPETQSISLEPGVVSTDTGSITASQVPALTWTQLTTGTLGVTVRGCFGDTSSATPSSPMLTASANPT
jgi:hypothetical protein